MVKRSVTVVGVSTGGESRSQIAAFARKKQVDYPMVIGDRSVAMEYEVHSIPTTYIIDAEGKIAAASRGFWDRDAMQAVVDRALRSR